MRESLCHERSLRKGAQPNFGFGEEEKKKRRKIYSAIRVDVTRTRASGEKLRGGIRER